MRRRLSFFAALVCVATCVIAGCGGSSPHSSPPAAPVQPAVATSQSAGGSVAPAGWGAPAPASAHLYALAPSSSTATMYDSVTVSAIPHDPFAAAGYTAGYWPTFLGLRHAYPDAHVVSIAITAGDHADCLDVEPGDATPAEAAGWVRADKAAGWPRPCVYSDWYEWTDELDPALEHAGISLRSVWRFDADYTGSAHIDAGFAATQWTDHCLDKHLDCSLVLRSFLAIAHPPLNPPAPPEPKPAPSQRLEALDELLGAYNRKTNPHGHDCEDPPFRHAYRSAAWDHACLVWREQRAAISKAGGS